jgi:hypothetical protein
LSGKQLNKNKIIQIKSTQNKIAQFLKCDSLLIVSILLWYTDSDYYRNRFKLIKRILVNKSAKIRLICVPILNISPHLKYNNPLLVSIQKWYADSYCYRNGFKLIKQILINKSVEISQNPSNLCPIIEY